MEQTPHLGCGSDSGADALAAKQMLLASERRLRALVANAFDGIAVLDAFGMLTFASPPLCAILGKEEHEALGPPIRDNGSARSASACWWPTGRGGRSRGTGPT
jgi:PAS domain-containing protein